jgi:hypothetical protein
MGLSSAGKPVGRFWVLRLITEPAGIFNGKEVSAMLFLWRLPS